MKMFVIGPRADVDVDRGGSGMGGVRRKRGCSEQGQL